ncbi:Hypothetical protein c3519 [Escherichia coli CFT073]|uniref:Uncharacterized protein n=1 Tax=Escherichia coli O6:H1 (strain CFT073 / ATCC 700928 / UPEC) TaxID=199310 RepID=A0A0H2VAL1_ECOL6|nr:Hypothetical protein c3519 [Escherichia coli CFT073]
MLCEKGRKCGPSDCWQSARCLCRMRRERLIRPTRFCKFNILQEVCRPDKRSASGSFVFAISLKGRESGPFLLSRDKRNCAAGDHGIGQFTVPTLSSGEGNKSGILPQSFTAQADSFCFSRTF